MRCRICSRVRRLFPDDLCSQCYYTVNGKILGDYMPEVDMMEIVRVWNDNWSNKQTKNCKKCGKTYPKTKHYFYSNGGKYLRPYCRQCSVVI